MAAIAVFALPAFGNGTQENSATTGNTNRLQDIGFHATGYPVVDKPLQVDAWVSKSPLFTVPYSQMTMLAELQKKTNVVFNFTEIPSDQMKEKVNLMFASRDYPDVLFGGTATDQNVWDAAQGGDLWALNDLVQQYAPDWQQAFAERPVIKKAITMPDGKYYALPYYRELTSDYAVRDIMSINKAWLQKLGLQLPTTTDQLYQVLLAFRKGIDDGTLPKNGVPWLARFHAWANGGEWEIYDAFGLWMKGQGNGAERYLSVNDGKVEFGATDPKLKDAVNYLHKLYAADILTPEMFTMTGGQYATANRTIPPYVGIFSAYFLYSNMTDYMEPLPPVKGPTGVRRFRSQPVRLQTNEFMIFKKSKYPEPIVRYIDAFASEPFALQASYGGHTIKQNSDGAMTVVGGDVEWRKNGPHNSFPGYISYKMDKLVKFEGDQGLRDQIIRKDYAPYIWPQSRHYAYITYTQAENDQLSVLSTEIGNYVENSIAKWIKDGNVDSEWDAYLAQLDKLGLKKAIELYQEAYDRFNK